MKVDIKKAMDFPSRAATFFAETDGASGSARGKDVYGKNLRLSLLSTLEGIAALNHADIGFIFVFVFYLAMMFYIGVHLHELSQTRLGNPTLPFRIMISLSLIGSLYEIMRVRHGRYDRMLLRWGWPGRIHLVAPLVGGIDLGIGVDAIALAAISIPHMIPFWDLIPLDALLGPIIEESLFRGCLLPIVARTTGPTVGIAVTAVLFATLHPISTFVQWLCFVTTRIASGWIGVKSGSTAASTLMHAAYNVPLFLCQGL